MRGASTHAVILCILFFAGRADADGPCVLRLDDASAPRAWRSAVDTAARGLVGADVGDCAEILVTPEARGAMVTFTTRDGRIAQRHILQPKELRPLVDALTVVLPSPAALETASTPPTPLLAITESSPAATVPVEEPRPELSLVPSPADDRTTTIPAPGRTALLAFAGGGATTGRHGDAVTPQGQLGIGVAFGAWELDLVGRIEAEHDLATTTRVHGNVEASSVGAGARVGRRENIGPLVLVTGAVIAAQYASIETHPSRTDRREVGFLEPRAGAFVGFVGPRMGGRMGRFRLRGEVLGELALAQRAGTADLPTTSGWGVGGMFGVETSFLP